MKTRMSCVSAIVLSALAGTCYGDTVVTSTISNVTIVSDSPFCIKSYNFAASVGAFAVCTNAAIDVGTDIDGPVTAVAVDPACLTLPPIDPFTGNVVDASAGAWCGECGAGGLASATWSTGTINGDPSLTLSTVTSTETGVIVAQDCRDGIIVGQGVSAEAFAEICFQSNAIVTTEVRIPIPISGFLFEAPTAGGRGFIAGFDANTLSLVAAAQIPPGGPATLAEICATLGTIDATPPTLELVSVVTQIFGAGECSILTVPDVTPIIRFEADLDLNGDGSFDAADVSLAASFVGSTAPAGIDFDGDLTFSAGELTILQGLAVPFAAPPVLFDGNGDGVFDCSDDGTGPMTWSASFCDPGYLPQFDADGDGDLDADDEQAFLAAVTGLNCPVPCNAADIDGDGDNDVFDALLLLDLYDPEGCAISTAIPCNVVDIDGDGDNDVFDVTAFLGIYDEVACPAE